MPDDKKILSALRSALKKDSRTQVEIASAVGCSQALVCRIKNGQTNPEGYYRKFCEVLGLDANTGRPRTIRLIVKGLKRSVGGTEKAMHDAKGAPVMNGGDDDVIPDEMEVSTSEAQLILWARQTKTRPEKEELQRLLTRVQASILTTGQKDAIAKIISEDYFGAAQTVMRIAETKSKR